MGIFTSYEMCKGVKNFDKKQIYFTNEWEEEYDDENIVDYILLDEWWKQLQTLIDDLHLFIVINYM